MAAQNPNPMPLAQGQGALNQLPPLQIPPHPGFPFPQLHQLTVPVNLQEPPIEIPPDGNLGALIDPNLFKVVIMRCTACVHEGAASVTLDRWQGPWKLLPNEFTMSAINAASNCPIQQLILKQHHLNSLPSNFAAPEALFSATLTMLDLSFNRFSSLPDVVCQLTQLKELYLNNNQISHLPKDMSSLKQLNVLYLQHNLLEELPVCCCGLQSLFTLNIENNHVKVIPDEVHLLVNLRELYAKSNQINGLPSSFCQLSLLEEVHFADNALVHMPNDLSGLKSLKQLHLANNRLRFIPLSFINLKNLQGLTIAGNDLKFPPLSACRNGVKELQSYMLKQYQDSSLEFEMLNPKGHMVECAISNNLYYDSGEETPYEDLDQD